MSVRSMEGKAAIVTGSTKGIGLATAEALLAEGARVMISARSAKEIAAVVKRLDPDHPGRVRGHPCDVRVESQVEDLFREGDRAFGGLDVLVNNAGVGIFKNLEEISLAEWSSVLETNLTGVFLCSRAAIPRMRRRGGGYIVNVSSLAGKNAFPGGCAYNASKFGLNGLSEALMQEVRYDGIRVSYVMPGSVNTHFGGAPDPGKDWKLTAGDVARVVVDLIRHDPRSLASRVEIRPSRPPRK
jgi:NAD(P)-dependent dehydrogenase (short-subunit alcohol dehydrogenase family)